MKAVQQLLSESDTDSETETVTVRSKPVQSRTGRIRNLDSYEQTVLHMTEIRQRMQMVLNGPEPELGKRKFVLTDADRTWERKNIIAPTTKQL